MSKPTKTKNKDEAKRLASELRALIPKLDSEGLSFLIEQAKIHLYNMKITEAQQLAEEAEKNTKQRRTAKSGTSGTTNKNKSTVLRIEAAEDSSSYHVVYGGKWKFFSADEMITMVKIANAEKDLRSCATRLYSWFRIERSDVLMDFEIDAANSPLVQEFISVLKSTFKIRNV